MATLGCYRNYIVTEKPGTPNPISKMPPARSLDTGNSSDCHTLKPRLRSLPRSVPKKQYVLYNPFMPETKSCGVLVFRNQPVRSFLLMVHPTRWDLPKGHLDPGEGELECALRELEEETGIRASHINIQSDFRFTTSYTVRYKNKFSGESCQKTLVIFLGDLLQDVPIVVTEHKGFRWIEWNPPHKIQINTIDPLLREVECYFTST